MTKDIIILHQDFHILQEYLDAMYPDRYEFQDDELVIYYPKVTIKDSTDNTYDIHKVFIHYGYNSSQFSFTKLHYSVKDYMNQTSYVFSHPHLSKGAYAYKSLNYCYGRLGISYTFHDINSVISAINVTDFWLHNENSSDCYINISKLYYNDGSDLLSNLIFDASIKDSLPYTMIKKIGIRNTIFGNTIDIDWDDEGIKASMKATVIDKMIRCSHNLVNIIDKYKTHVVNFKDKDYYMTIESFDAEDIITNTKSNINENVVEQLKDLAAGITKNTHFLQQVERYYFKC